MSGSLKHRLSQLSLVFSPQARRGFALATAGSIAVALMETGAVLLVAPLLQLLMGSPIDTGVLGTISDLSGITTRSGMIFLILGLVVAGFVIKDLFTLSFRWWANGFINSERARTYVALLEYYLNAPYAILLDRSTPQMLRVLGNSTGQVYALVAAGIMSIVIESTTVLTIGLALIIATPTYAVGLMVFFGLTAMIMFRAIRATAAREGLKQLELSEQGYKIALHSLGGAKEIKLRHTQKHFTDLYRDVELRSARSQRITATLGELPKNVLEIIFFIAFFVLTTIVVLTQGVSTLVVSIGLLAAGAFRILPALSRLVSAFTSVRTGLPALDDVAGDLAAAKVLPPAQLPASTPLPFTDKISVEDLHFRYRPDSPDVLHGIDLEIPAGSSIAFVGSSGAGKSTLVDTLLGLHMPTSGRILVDGQDIASDPAAWHANIAVVPQDVYLLDATLRENIAFDQHPDLIDDDLVAECLRRAQLTEFVAELPDGILTEIGERGARLSGGQRQRLGIARALYRRPRLLVLDEATSALDNETERRITETIESLHGEITVIIVAHRLSTIRNVDAIAFMTGGRIEAMGTFSEVRQRSQEFARLVELGDLSTEQVKR